MRLHGGHCSSRPERTRKVAIRHHKVLSLIIINTFWSPGTTLNLSDVQLPYYEVSLCLLSLLQIPAQMTSGNEPQNYRPRIHVSSISHKVTD